MTVVEITRHGTTVAVERGRLAVGAARLPVEDVDLIIAEVPAVSVTGDALLLLGQQGIELVVCDRRHQPAALLQPAACPATLGARTLRLQAALTPRRARALWRQVVRAKLTAQAHVLAERGHGDAARLVRLARETTAGDAGNREAQGARLYWPALFGPDFRRHAEDDTNAMLNFGYAVVRALVARQIHAAGLHRALGFHHDNAENDGNLADDLLEPFRPAVDRLVLALQAANRPMDREARTRLAGLGDWPVRQSGEWLRLRQAVRRLCLSYRNAVEGAAARLALPDRIGGPDDARRMADDVGSGVL